MVDVSARPLIAQQGNIRVEPFAQPAQSPVAGLPPSVQRTLGPVQVSTAPSSPAENPDADGDGKLSAEEVGHLQEAAAQGDKESFDLLNALKLPLGIAAGAAALYGAGRSGTALLDAVAKAKGIEMVPSGRTGGVHAAPEPQKMLPNPVKQITDQTAGRFNQPAIAAPPALEDMRTPYEKGGGKLPTGKAAGEALKNAAKALRRG